MMEKCVTGKRIYHSQEMAEEALIDAWGRNNYRKGSGPVNVYQCRDCNRWHWTSQGEMNQKLNKGFEDGSIRRDQEANNWRNSY